jgi:hypothetical protein
MKTTNKKEKTFDTVKVFREIKERIAKETEKMTFAEFKEYLNKHKMQAAK